MRSQKTTVTILMFACLSVQQIGNNKYMRINLNCDDQHQSDDDDIVIFMLKNTFSHYLRDQGQFLRI